MSGPGDYHPHHPHSYAPPGLNPPDLQGRYDPNLALNPPELGGGPGAATRGKRKAANDDEEDDEKPATGGAKEGKGGASEFVKKLYRMLEDGQFTDIVSWGYSGDSFVVKDMNSFTRSILPLHFKHSNFASFVRQLNKYDFHKVKNPEEGGSPYGEHTWEFKHPSFRADMKSSLENIKRKAPAPRKSTPQPARGRGPGGAIDPMLTGGDLSGLQAQLDQLHRSQQGMQQHMNSLSQDYQAVIGEMMNFQRNMVAQDQLMQNLIQYLVNLEADQKAASNPGQPQSDFVPSSQAQKLISTYTEVARASYEQMADLSRRASLSGGAFQPMPPPPGFGHLDVSRGRREENGGGPGGPPGYGGRDDGYRGPDGSHQPPHGGPPPPQHGGPSHEQQQQQQQQQPPSHPPPQHFQHPNAPADAPRPDSADGRPGAARRQAYVPGWAVPPRVLLVEDDAVCRKLSSKFLEVFGCSIDVAVDGVSAVNKMNLQKYDLVLMDIVMPNLDGVSATSLIRQFDPMTPIISMTSNSGPNEIMTYFSHGMNDILPKPFTKEGLLGMLEKHLIHLKVMQQMAEIPRALGFTDNQIQDALAVSTVGEEGNVINPFSAMGISDHDYVEMLQGIALEKEGKRGLEVVQGNEREGKRARFQEVDQ
ncbi:HSF-type DNA-binding-domain-containing protein [Leucosporidium creatinivorum]|uniref:HSF-type DNA-binding-domain-containing protein n=1 Tax=Leucosporidium creatinivorum TaxID=106004 RepID=A0A1Y2C980_9BASI|nr:HSF-type DNA-binding-domain-containing protein [Leucosporidium creatinivorum]